MLLYGSFLTNSLTNQRSGWIPSGKEKGQFPDPDMIIDRNRSIFRLRPSTVMFALLYHCSRNASFSSIKPGSRSSGTFLRYLPSYPGALTGSKVTVIVFPLAPAPWKIAIHLLPGRYEYNFVVDGNWVEDMLCSEMVPNPFGTRNSVIVVE